MSHTEALRTISSTHSSLISKLLLSTKQLQPFFFYYNHQYILPHPNCVLYLGTLLIKSFHLFFKPYSRGAKVFQKFRSHLNIPGAKKGPKNYHICLKNINFVTSSA
jgi:hypothetical protein